MADKQGKRFLIVRGTGVQGLFHPGIDLDSRFIRPLDQWGTQDPGFLACRKSERRCVKGGQVLAQKVDWDRCERLLRVFNT